jgi:hypothetical protein
MIQLAIASRGPLIPDDFGGCSLTPYVSFRHQRGINAKTQWREE